MRIELEYDKMEHALKRVLLEFGVSILNEPVRFMAVWKDYGAGLVDEGELIQKFLKLNLVPSLLDANYDDMDSRVRWCKWASEYMASNGVDQNEAKKLVQIWARALCWESPKPSVHNKQENIVEPQMAPANVVVPGVVRGGQSATIPPQKNTTQISGRELKSDKAVQGPEKVPNTLSVVLRLISLILYGVVFFVFVSYVFIEGMEDIVSIIIGTLVWCLVPYILGKVANGIEINNAKKYTR